MHPPKFLSLLGIILVSLTILPSSIAQQIRSDSKRRIITQVSPVYPEMAKSIRLGGIVRLRATVASGGKVVRTEVLGGSPLLVLSATNAVSRFTWEPRSEETKETIEVNYRYGAD
jgi:outer membrane biosynthesis protein TonB